MASYEGSVSSKIHTQIYMTKIQGQLKINSFIKCPSESVPVQNTLEMKLTIHLSKTLPLLGSPQQTTKAEMCVVENNLRRAWVSTGVTEN